MTAIGCRNSKSSWLRLVCALIFVGAACPAIATDIDADELAARREKIAGMSEFDRNSLTEKQAKFLAMPASEQDAIRRLHDELDADARGDGSLNELLRNYQAWLKKLPPWQRAEIHAEHDPEKRIALIRRIKEQEGTEAEQPAKTEPGKTAKSPEGNDPRRRRGSLPRLTEADFEKIVDVVAKNLQLPAEEREAWEKLSSSHRHIKILMKSWERQKTDEGQPPRERWPSDDLMNAMLEAVTDAKTRERLQESERTPDQRRWLMRQMVFRALMRESWDELKKRRPTDEQMVAYFRSLKSEERENEMRQWADGHRQRLTWRYLEEKGDPYSRDLAQLQKALAPTFGRNDGRPPGPDRNRRGRPDGDKREGFPRRPQQGRDAPPKQPAADSEPMPK